MTVSHFISAFLFFAIIIPNAHAYANLPKDAASDEAMTGEQYLFQVQDDIENALARSYGAQDGSAVDELKIIIGKLNDIDPLDASTVSYYKDYWLAYGHYNLAIELLRLNKNKKQDKLERQASIKSAMTILEDMPQDTEVSALYGIVAGLNYEFLPFRKIFAATEKINLALEVSLKSNPENIRALYANAVSDFYTPEQYGGGRKAHGFLMKAIQEEKVQQSPPLEPNWGHQESFVLLIQYYLKKGDENSAKETYRNLLNLYPDTRYKLIWDHLLEKP